MATFSLGDYSIEFVVEPLVGPLAPSDRQIAWQVYLELVARPALHADAPSGEDLSDLISALRALLAQWPASQVDQGRPGQLGFAVLSMIEWVLLPLLQQAQPRQTSWPSVRSFCRAFASDLARSYRFVDTAAAMPADLQLAWQDRR